jgi:hypothetical protein
MKWILVSFVFDILPEKTSYNQITKKLVEIKKSETKSTSSASDRFLKAILVASGLTKSRMRE